MPKVQPSKEEIMSLTDEQRKAYFAHASRGSAQYKREHFEFVKKQSDVLASDAEIEIMKKIGLM